MAMRDFVMHDLELLSVVCHRAISHDLPLSVNEF